MKDLRRLVRVIEENGPSTNPLLNLQDADVLETKLYHLLKEDREYSEEEIARTLYGDSKQVSGYRMLKSRFRKKLINYLHFMEIPPSRQRTGYTSTYKCLTLLTEAQALLLFSEIKLSLKVFDQALAIANEFENTEMKIKALEGKRRVFQSLSNTNEYTICHNELIKLYEIQDYERKAVALYDQTMLLTRGKTSERAKIFSEYPEIIKDITSYWEKSGSSMIFSYLHILRIAYLEQAGRYTEIAEEVANAEKLVQAKKVNSKWFNKAYSAYINVYALLQSRQYNQGLTLAEKSLSHFQTYSANWYAYMENYVLLTLHSKKYVHTGKLLSEVTYGDFITKLPDIGLERWELYRRYLSFMLKFVSSDNKQAIPGAIVTQLPILSKDKSGFNLALLVLDVLEKLSEGIIDDLDVQAERVRKYTHKYLKGEKAERPRLFMRLLHLALTKVEPEVVREQAEKLFEKLQVTPLPGDAFTEVEVVPYEHLWELALQLLEQQQVRR